MNEAIGYTLAVIAAAAVLYFIYKKYQASQAKKFGSGRGGGSSTLGSQLPK